MGSKSIPMPRLTGMTADLQNGPIEYRYSGGVDVAVQETKSQHSLRQALNHLTGASSTCGLWNAYGYVRRAETETETEGVVAVPGDKASIGRHSDDERDISIASSVPMVIGVTWLSNPDDKWVLVLRSKLKGPGGYTTHKIVMKHNQAFCMAGQTFQDEWTHEIPKSSKTFPHPGQRVSVTYRHIRPNARSNTKRRARHTAHTEPPRSK